MKNFVIPVDIYDKDVMVHIGYTDTLIDEVGKLDISDKEYNTVMDEIKSIDGFGYTISIDNGATIIYIDNVISIERTMYVAIHECYHAANAIMRSIGVYPSLANEECFAYLQEYLFKQIMDKLNYGIHVNHKNS